MKKLSIKTKNLIMSDNKGLSMVELLIAVTISVIIMGAAGYFLSTAIRNYFAAETAIELQQESQIFTEQLSKWCMEANYVEVVTTSSGQDVLLIYEIPEYFEPTKWPVGVTYHNRPDTWGTVRGVWLKDDCVYTASYKNNYYDSSYAYPLMPDDTTIDGFITAKTLDKNILLDNVSAFTPTTTLVNVDPTGATDANVTETLNVNLSLTKTWQTFDMSDEILVRNELISQFATIRARMAGIR